MPLAKSLLTCCFSCGSRWLLCRTTWRTIVILLSGNTPRTKRRCEHFIDVLSQKTQDRTFFLVLFSFRSLQGNNISINNGSKLTVNQVLTESITVNSEIKDRYADILIPKARLGCSQNCENYFVMSVCLAGCPPVHMKLFGSHWMDFHELLIF